MKTLFKSAFMMLVLCLASNVTTAQATVVQSVSDTQNNTEAEPKTDKDALVKKYPWVKKLIKETAEGKLNISEVMSEGVHDFLLVETNESKILYDTSGKPYCTSHASLDCNEFYKITPGELKWNRKS